MFYLKWDQFVDYPMGFMSVIIRVQFETKIGLQLVIRQFAIIIFICRMHCFLFKSCYKYFTQLSKNYRKNYFNICLSFHHKICESVEEFKTFLRPMFVLITTIFCSISLNTLYFTFEHGRFETMIIMCDIIALVIFIFTITLAVIIALIDVEAKIGMHSVYGCALKLSNNQAVFSVSLLSINFFY